MIGFFDPWDGSATRPVSEIVKIIDPVDDASGTSSFCMVTMRGGEQVRVLDMEARDLVRRPAQIMPAEVGTKLINYVLEDPAEHWTTSVIGWALCGDGIVRPMTPAGPVFNGGMHSSGVFVLLPDGSVSGVGPDADEYRNVEVMMDALKRNRAMTLRMQAGVEAQA